MEEERKQKLAVKDKNDEYLRNAKQDISRQLDKTTIQTRSLEDRVIELEEENQKQKSFISELKSKCKSYEHRERKANDTVDKATKERNSAKESLLRKTKELRTKQSIFDANKQELDQLRTQVQNQRV